MLHFIAEKQIIKYTDNETFETAYKYFRELILGGKLPLLIPIGIKVPASLAAGSALDRVSGIFESMASIAANSEGIIFTIPELVQPEIYSEPCTGKLFTDKVRWYNNASLQVNVITTPHHILTSSEQVRIVYRVKYITGYRSIEENQKELDIAYYPLNAYASLAPYVKILPPNGHSIRVRYTNGMTAEVFSELLKKGSEVYDMV
jgi:hypothetical protein